MSFPRLVPVIALAAGALALPGTASAALTLTPTSITPAYPSDTDGIISPGDTFDFTAHFSNTGGGSYQGGKGQLSTTEPNVQSIATSSATFSELNGDVANDPSYPQVDLGTGPPSAPVRFRATLTNSFQCGKNVPFSLTLSGNDGTFGPHAINVPTGAPGALRTYGSSQAGGAILNGSETNAIVSVPTASSPDTATDFTRGVQIHLDKLDYVYTPHWLKIELVSPDGAVATVWDDSERSAYAGRDANFENNHWQNLTFVSQGDPSGIDVAANPNGFVNGATIQANDDLNAVLAGAKRSGDWKLRISDIEPPSDARSFRSSRGRSAGTDSVGTLGDWQLGVRAAVCGAPGQKTGPDAWFGGQDPLVLDPVSGGTVSASAVVAKSEDPSFTPPTITSYAWDTTSAAGQPGTNFVTGSSTLTLPGQPRGTKAVKLRVTDSNGNTSTSERTVIFSEIPTIENLAANPSQPQAGEAVALSATLGDSAGADKIAKIQWDLDDNGSFEAETGPSTTADPNKVTSNTSTTFASAGTHTIRVRVINDLGAVATQALVITTANQPPVAKFSFVGYADGNLPVLQVGQSITFDGGASFDNDGSVGQWEWNVDAGTTNAFTSSGANKTYTTSYSAPGIYSVQLRVTDNLGMSATVEHDLKVTAAPVARAVASTSTPAVGQTVTFDGSTSSDSDGSVAALAWDLDGNGSFETSGTTAAKAYPNPGTVAVKLKVTDNDGATNVAIVPITVQGSSGGGGGGGGGGATPAPTPTPAPGTKAPDVVIPGGGGTIPSPVVVSPAQAAAQVTDIFKATSTDAGTSVQLDDFAAAISVSSKQKGKKAYKKGVAVALKATDASKFTVRAMITKSYAKKAGIKTKAKLLTVGSGKVVLKKGGKAKFYVKFKKKYASKLKRQTKMVVLLRGVVAVTETGDKVALAKKITIKK